MIIYFSLVAALSELSDVYFRTGNPQVGNIYRKVYFLFIIIILL